MGTVLDPENPRSTNGKVNPMSKRGRKRKARRKSPANRGKRPNS